MWSESKPSSLESYLLNVDRFLVRLQMQQSDEKR